MLNTFLEFNVFNNSNLMLLKQIPTSSKCDNTIILYTHLLYSSF